MAQDENNGQCTSSLRAVVYYSWSGHGEKLAGQLTAELGCDTIGVHELRHPNVLSCLFAGVPRAWRQSPAPGLAPIPSLSGYQEVTIIAPIWGNMPAPAFNNIVASLAKGTHVKAVLLSDSGKSNKDKVVAQLDRLGLVLDGYSDVNIKDIAAS